MTPFSTGRLRHLPSLLLPGLLVGCQPGQPPPGQPTQPAAPPPAETSEVQLEEVFTDSLHIGRVGRNKLAIAKFRTPDSLYVDLRFYARQPGGWRLRNTFHFRKDGITDLDPTVSDFNHDGLRDFSYQSNAAARAGNKMQRLFLYDQRHDRLVSIRNAESYPNLRYNQYLDCLDAFLLFGGCATSFLKISGDTLREVARVELAAGLTLHTYDRQGRVKTTCCDSTNKAELVRYCNYHPLQAYADEDF